MSSPATSPSPSPSTSTSTSTSTKLDSVDVEVVALLADHPRLLQRRGPVAEAVADAGLRDALRQLAVRDVGSAKLDLAGLTEMLDASVRAQVSAAAMSGSYADVASPERALDGFGARRRRDSLLGERTELKKKLA